MSRVNLRGAVLGSAVALAGLAAAWYLFADGGGSELPIYWHAPDFALVDQRGDTLRSAELRGTPWLASFVFTNCTGVCPMISGRMARLRDTLAARGDLPGRIRLVSITVDPARDTPEVLERYAERFGGSPPSEWAFLTGGSPDSIRSMIQNGFRVSAVDPGQMPAGATSDYQVQHSPRILLVDRTGRVRGTYDAIEQGLVGRVLADLDVLLRR